MNIREGLEKIFEEYDKAKTQSFGGNETAQFIRNGFAQIIKDSGVLGKRGFFPLLVDFNVKKFMKQYFSL